MDRCDVLLVGGGIAGLWSLHALRAAGYDARLLEARALGEGQSIQAQGIVHGGGKYALRNVGDVDAARAIREMPARWGAALRGEGGPDLREAQLLSPECWLWLPRRSLLAWVERLGLLPLLRGGGVLAFPPRKRAREDWPELLRRHALGAWSMAEPVLGTASVLAALGAAQRDHIRLYDAGAGLRGLGGHGPVRLRAPGGEELSLQANAVVLCAGAGNEELLAAAGTGEGWMQRRPLRMLLLRGPLPDLHGHCIRGGRTLATVTSVPLDDGRRAWQVGGELAERGAEMGEREFLAAAVAGLRRVLPGLDLSGVEASSYTAVRAEAVNAGGRRPSGVQLQRVAGLPLWAAWPTKWAMAPLLADELLAELRRNGLRPQGAGPREGWSALPPAAVARPPWEECEWSDARWG